MARRGKVVERRVRPTVLIVAEGAAEYEFLRHVRQQFLADRIGCALTLHNAGGKGAGNVIDIAIGRRRVERFGAVGALFDSDCDWTAANQARAKKGRVAAIVNDPCLERTLLQMVGNVRVGDSLHYKRTFAARFGGNAHQDGIIADNFSRDMLINCRARVAVLSDLLGLLQVP